MEMAGNERVMTVEGLAAEVASLGARVEEISERLRAIESSGRVAEMASREAAAPVSDAHEAEGRVVVPDEEGLWAWLGRNAVLPRVAAACFILVVALILRTLTDSGGVSPTLGTVLGLSYVAILFVCGWRFYAAGRTLAPVFTGCGLLLLFSLIAESRTHFSILPAWLGSTLLVGVTAAAVAVSLAYRSRPLLWFAVMGAMLVSLILDFPDTVFPAAAAILMVGLAGSLRGAAIGLDRGVRWPVLLGVMFLFFLWGFKLNFAIARARVDPVLFPLAPKLFSAWFMPAVLAFAFSFWGIAGRRIFKDIPLGGFGHLLPFAGALIMVMDGRVAMVNWWQRPQLMGVMLVFHALLLLAMVVLKHKSSGGRGSGNGFASMAVAAALMLFASFPWLFGGPSVAQIFWPLIFVVFLLLSRYTDSGNMRFLAAFIAFLVKVCGTVSGVYSGRIDGGAVNWLACLSGIVAGLGAYLWCRRNAPPQSGFFKHTDQKDYAALSFLVSGLVSLFFLSSLILARVVEILGSDAATLDCGRTILINIGAAILIVWGAIIRKDPGVAMVGIVVALIGGGKVFFFDFFGAGGVPLVMSVTSFGALAALCSVVLGDWQKMYGGQARVTG